MHTGVHRVLAFELLVNNTSSCTLAFSLRLVPFLPVADSPATLVVDGGTFVEVLLNLVLQEGNCRVPLDDVSSCVPYVVG